MIIKKIILFYVVLLFLPVVSEAQPSSDISLTLEQCISIALKHNPLVLSAFQERIAATERVTQKDVFPIPSIDFNSDIQPQPFNFFQAEEHYLGVTQTFEFPGKRKKRVEIAQFETLEVDTDLELLRLDIIFSVKEAFYQLLLAQEQRQYALHDHELSQDYLTKADLKFSAGDVARVEVLRAKVEALKSANAVETAENSLKIGRSRLNGSLSRRSSSPLNITGSLHQPFVDLELNNLKQEAFELRPEILQISSSLRREMLKQEQSKLSYWPDFDINFSLHTIEGFPATWSFSASAPLSFLFKKQPDSEIAESIATSRALQRRRDHIKNNISIDVEEAFTNALTARNQIVLFRDEVLPQAEEVYEMLLFSYQEGELAGIELIEARRTLNESRKSLADALFNYSMALAILDKAVGRTP